MISSLHEHVTILYIDSKPCWEWYADQVQLVQTLVDGFRYSAQLAMGRCAREPHVADIATKPV